MICYSLLVLGLENDTLAKREKLQVILFGSKVIKMRFFFQRFVYTYKRYNCQLIL